MCRTLQDIFLTSPIKQKNKGEHRIGLFGGDDFNYRREEKIKRVPVMIVGPPKIRQLEEEETTKNRQE